MNRYNDSQLLLLLCNNPEEGLAALLDHYGGAINAIAGRVLRQSPADAEECAADVLVAAWKNAAMLQQQRRPLKGWLCLTARNMALNRLGRLRRDRSVELDEEQAADWALVPRTTEAEEIIRQLVEAMGPPDQEIFIRKYYLLEPAKEIGRLLGMTENTVNAHLSRGRAKLRQQFLLYRQEQEELAHAY